MKEPVFLLEKSARYYLKHQTSISGRIRSQDTVYLKLQAPIEHFVGKVGVTMQRTFMSNYASMAYRIIYLFSMPVIFRISTSSSASTTTGIPGMKRQLPEICAGRS
jgi:hypothetical protein